jgi:ring-1,2-phenylacetyl-CoA epoxidase subunit PaaC
VSRQQLFEYLLRLGDDSLVLGHRLSEWCGHAPALEEDIALANIALDHIGRARALLSYAGELEGKGRDEDALAYLRDGRDYHNVLLVEQPNGDFAATIVRQFLYDAFMVELLTRLGESADAQLAAIAAKSLKETRYHLRHSSEWLIRLGDGTELSRAKAQAALDELWFYTGELFEMDGLDAALLAAGIAVDLSALKADWDRRVDEVLAEATLTRPADAWMQSGGRQGRHSEHLGYLLAELQYVQRAYPGMTW